MNQSTFEKGQSFKIILTAHSNRHGTRDELLAAAEACARKWAEINGWNVELLSIQTKGLVWTGSGVQRVTAEVNLKNA